MQCYLWVIETFNEIFEQYTQAPSEDMQKTIIV